MLSVASPVLRHEIAVISCLLLSALLIAPASVAAQQHAAPAVESESVPIELTFRLAQSEFDDNEVTPHRAWVLAGRTYSLELNAVRDSQHSRGVMQLAITPPTGVSVAGGELNYTGDSVSRKISAELRFDQAGTYEIRIEGRHLGSGFQTISVLRVTVAESLADLDKVRGARQRATGAAPVTVPGDLREASAVVRDAAPAGYARITGVAVTYPYSDGRRYPLRGLEIELWEQGGARLAGPIHTVETTTASRCGLDKSVNYVDASGVWQHSDNSGYFDFGNVAVGASKNLYFKLRYQFFAGGDGSTYAGVQKIQIIDSTTARVIEYNTAAFTAVSTAAPLKVVYGPDLGTPGTIADEAAHAFYDTVRTFGYFRDCNTYTNWAVPVYINLTSTDAPSSSGSAAYLSAWTNNYLTYEATSSIMHEYSHTIHWSMRGGSFPPLAVGDRNHGGCANSDSSDGMVEGWARYTPVMMAADPVYRWGAAETLDLSNHANTSACDRDEYMVGGTWWDLWNQSEIDLVTSEREISKTLELRDPNLFRQYYDGYIADWGRCVQTWTVFNSHNAGYPNTCGLTAPSNPSPPDLSLGEATTATLSWLATGATSYNVYFGTSSSPPFVATAISTSFSPGALAPGTTYYWRVTSTDSVSTFSSAIWKFSTVAAVITPGPSSEKVAVFRGGVWYIDVNGNGIWDAGDKAFGWGSPSAIPVLGDWNGDGKTKVGIFDHGIWYLDTNGSGVWDAGDLAIGWGAWSDTPVVGDWNGNGKTKIGVYTQTGVWYLDTNGSGIWDAGDLAFGWGGPGAIPVIGDWNHNGRAKIGVFMNGVWYLDVNGSTIWDAGDAAFAWGSAASIPVVGDWNGDGRTKVGVFNAGTWYLDFNGNMTWDAGDKAFVMGSSTSTPIVGDWSGNGITKVGTFENGLWFLDLDGSFSVTASDLVVRWGAAGDKPIIGKW